MSHKVLLFLGAGRNVGAASVALFKSKGYKVASVSRSIKSDIKTNSDLYLTADFSDPRSVQEVYNKVEQELGIPNVVIYNPYSWSMGPEPSNPVSAPLADFEKDLNINTVSAYVASQAAVNGFRRLPENVKKTFIYTGNNGNTIIVPEFLMLGIGKTATWYMIQSLAAANVLSANGQRFYYVDERTPAGKATPHISGPAHAEYFLHLAEKDGQSDPFATFVRGKGYVKFESNDRAVLPRVTTAEILDPGFDAPGTPESRYGY
ncbi:hypothetical protein BKA63DRAFT_559656 [Paraphoma chrysanthemicola]|nr:hypothetical protein BKA63DRAFT_559656 [Paraphoma chrysanthemicola]